MSIDRERLERAMATVLRADGAPAGLCESDAEAIIEAYKGDFSPRDDDPGRIPTEPAIAPGFPLPSNPGEPRWGKR